MLDRIAFPAGLLDWQGSVVLFLLLPSYPQMSHSLSLLRNYLLLQLLFPLRLEDRAGLFRQLEVRKEFELKLRYIDLSEPLAVLYHAGLKHNRPSCRDGLRQRDLERLKHLLYD